MANLAAVQRPISSLPIAAKISVPGSPDWVGIAPNAVWISNAGADSLARIDPHTNKVAKIVPVGRQPCSGLAVGFGAVWAPSCTDHRIDRVDLQSNAVVAHIPTSIGNSEGGIAADEKAIWLVANSHGKLVRIDPVLNTVDGHVKIADGSFVPIAGAGAVWISSTTQNLVSRVDPTGCKSSQKSLSAVPHFMASTETDIWVLNQGAGTVSRIDIASNQWLPPSMLVFPAPGETSRWARGSSGPP
jgi:YVTN family beta-propeller protein